MFIFDIDGTLANAEHRLHHIKKDPPDWDTFNESALLMQDSPIYPIISIANALYNNDEHIVMLTGRRCSTRHDTMLWLSTHFVQYHTLLMRPTGDHRPDYIVKLELLRAYLDSVPVEQRYVDTMFEDRKEATRQFRNRGFHVCQVAEGDY